MEIVFLMDLLVGAGIPPTAAKVAADMIDAGMAVASIVTFLSGLGVGLTVIRMALKASGKKAIVA
ncbi:MULTISPECIES: hypothetical protein [Bacillus]|uniref:hypothetical protein n=1 Tax=Bacillus TaxID=1386 RepID=UPI000DBC20F3|nr:MULTISPECIES: hypothetical protein [Bacillus]MCY7670117.1 hypothetical protein [Bacillus altitudinis]MDN4638058.1 hypothetical protein [Bacillus sp. PsM16]MXP80901.1 hypothetical protein [Bacillus sp. AN2]TFW49605.1 hypothetical protein ES896_04020 [Bacillus sp. 005/A4HT-01/001]SPR91852.1 Carnocyclin-A [Bacillus altitudinis]